MSPPAAGEAHGTAPGGVSRSGLRATTFGWGGPPGDALARVLRIDPGDNATGVFRDTPVVATLSHVADRSSVSDEVLVVTQGGEVVRGRVALSPDGRVLVWRGEKLLCPGALHHVSCSGVRDLRGRPVLSRESRFLPCDVTWEELHP